LCVYLLKPDDGVLLLLDGLRAARDFAFCFSRAPMAGCGDSSWVHAQVRNLWQRCLETKKECLWSTNERTSKSMNKRKINSCCVREQFAVLQNNRCLSHDVTEDRQCRSEMRPQFELHESA
jgi:hypothetical protein